LLSSLRATIPVVRTNASSVLCFTFDLHIRDDKVSNDPYAILHGAGRCRWLGENCDVVASSILERGEELEKRNGPCWSDPENLCPIELKGYGLRERQISDESTNE
jgi:hypothetical protein